jgi:hypothetical protein
MKAWAGSELINPIVPVPLAGFGLRTAAYTEVADDLELNACTIQGEDQMVVFLTFDTLSVGKAVSEYAKKAFGRLDAHVVCVASHTHFAPSLDSDLPQLGRVDEDYLGKVLGAIDSLALRFAREGCREVDIVVGKSDFNCGINRRRKAWGPKQGYSMHMLPNPRVNAGDGLATLDIRTVDDGRLLARLWRCSCHPVSFYSQTSVSSDFIGIVRQSFRSTTPKLPVLFFQGFSGDIRPPSISHDRSLVSRLRRLIHGDFFGTFSEESWKMWAQQIIGSLSGCEGGKKLSGEAIEHKTTNVSLKDLHQTNEDYGGRPGLEITSVNIGRELNFVFFSGEPVTGWHDLIPKHPTREMWLVGYASHTFGYLPTSKVMQEGGYEAEGFRSGFSLPGRFVVDIDKTVLEAFNRLRA